VLIPFVDIHTHNPVISEEIISVPSLFLQDIDLSNPFPSVFTAGIHPWHAENFNLDEIKKMLECLTNQPKLIAVGESGLDKKCKTDLKIQKLVFELHIDFAAENQKPLIIHCVNSWNELLPYSIHSNVPFILHGYNAGAELTIQLVRYGFYFSIGKAILKENSKLRQAIQVMPNTSLLFETDDDKFDVREIYQTASKILNCTVEELKRQIFINYNKIFYKL